MVSVPVRAAPVFAATAKVTFPLPVPPFVTVIHGTLLVAVHAQPAFVVTLTLPFPPFAPMLAEVEDSVITQPVACVIVKFCPPAVIVPVLAAPALAATV